jgi:ComF family protein
MRGLIHLFKYKHKSAVLPVLRLLLEQHLRWDAELAAHDLIVPVPLHRRRLQERGFNQAVFWGKLVSEKYGIPVKSRLLRRTRWTAPQVILQGDRRRNNVRHAFSVSKTGALRDARVLLVDDVYTTGATMQECARILKKAGAARVDGFVIARAV